MTLHRNHGFSSQNLKTDNVQTSKQLGIKRSSHPIPVQGIHVPALTGLTKENLRRQRGKLVMLNKLDIKPPRGRRSHSMFEKFTKRTWVDQSTEYNEGTLKQSNMKELLWEARDKEDCPLVIQWSRGKGASGEILRVLQDQRVPQNWRTHNFPPPITVKQT